MKTAKNQFKAVIASVLLAILICGCTQNQNDIKGPAVPQKASEATLPTTGQKFLVYNNPEAGIEMKYPADWLKCEGIGENGDLNLSFSLGGSDVDTLMRIGRANVAVWVWDLSAKPTTLKEWANQRISFANSISPGLRVDSSDNYTLSSKPAYGIFRSSENGYKDMEIFTVKNNKLYLIRYYSEYNITAYPRNLETAKEMIDSFTISEVKSPAVTQTASQAELNSTGQKFRMYDNPEYGVRMKYPADWLKCEKINEYGDLELIFHKETPVVVDAFIVNLSEKDRTLNSLKEWVDYYSAPVNPDWKVESSNNYTLSSSPATRILRTKKDGYTDMAFLTQKNNTLYVVRYFTVDNNSEGYLKNLGTAEEMIDSFTITKS